SHDIYGTPLPPKNALKQNQYGFTFGGPLLLPKIYNGHNRTFFFYSYEAGRQRTSNVSNVLVPTAAERNGDFSDWRDNSGNLVPIYNPSSEVGGNPATRTPFANNQIPASAISTIAKNYMSLLPQPNVPVADMAACAQTNGNGSGACTNYVASLNKPYDTDNNTFRLDENLSDRDRLYVTGILGEQKFDNPSAIPLTGEIKYQKNHLLGVNWQHTITPSMFNEARVGYNWMDWRNGSDAANGKNYGQLFGFANVPGNPRMWGVPNIVYNGFQAIGDTNSGWTQKENNYQFVDNLKWVHAKHTLTVGTDVRRYMLSMIAAFGSTGVVNFDGSYTGLNPNLSHNSSYATAGAGSSIADFLLGNPINISGPAPGGSDLFDVRATNWNFFAQDDFRVTPRLTLNLGLRYEIPPAYHDIYNSGAQLDMANGGGFLWANKNVVNTVQQLGGYPFLARCCVDNKLVPPDHKDLAPRIGIAWRPFSTDRFVIRAGYGIFYDLENQWYSLTTYDNISTIIGQGVNYPTSTGATPAAPNPLGTLWLPSPNDYSFFGAGASPFPSYVPFVQINWPRNRSPYNQQWTLDTQYALKQNLLLDIGYIGSHSVRQPGYWYYNAATMPAVDDPCDRYRTAGEAAGDPTCAGDPNFIPALARNHFANISSHAYAVANLFSANYNALQVRLNQRLSHGLLYQLNYTWSRTFDNVSAINNIPTSSLTLQNNNCFSCDYGPAAFDQPSRFVASGTYEIPIGRGHALSLGPANWILGGWNFSGIYTVASGMPETLFAGFGGIGEDGVRADLRRPNQVGNPNAPVFGALNPTAYPVAKFRSEIFHWFNPAAFAAAAGNQYGNVGRDSIRQPYFMRGDITLEKAFPLTERQQFEFGLQIFNVFSLWHSNINGGPNGGGGIQGNLQAGNFGSLVPIDSDASGNPLPESLQSGFRRLWNPRTIQFLAKYSF
ncbi:MAG: TonB-dependent receptor, partial [Acidobacteria bacterium]|nr:TonB-dependent receptor [Acidobacteriota bacterium]